MREKIISKNTFYIFFGAITILFIFCLHFILSYLKAQFFFQEALSKNLVEVELEKINIYKEIFSLLDKSIFLCNLNSAFYEKKADFILKAFEENLGNELFVEEKDVETLYKKAINLNPLNYVYHLKLGWFYFKQNNLELAQKYLSSARLLYPTDYQTYFYLISFYFANRKEWEGFKELLYFVYFMKENVFQLLNSLKEKISVLSYLSVDQNLRLIKFSFLKNFNFDFKDLGLPNLKLPLTIKVYAKKNLEQIALYKGYEFYSEFKNLGNNTYELELDKKYLDDFNIQVAPPSEVEKIEFIVNF
ncbi:MAG: hypothetical protein NC918_04195 [Candidatus Omnitrophica bacterium]|nr:hypothetical protein [Candidatus Omnitrophota bacterium]